MNDPSYAMEFQIMRQHILDNDESCARWSKPILNYFILFYFQIFTGLSNVTLMRRF